MKYGDEVTAWLRKAQHYFDKGKIDKGKQYLIRLCNEYENYEESFEFRGLTPVCLRRSIQAALTHTCHITASISPGLMM